MNSRLRVQTASKPEPGERKRLLTAAAEAFAEGSYFDSSLADVAARSHVSEETFDMFFDSKVDCLLAAHQEAFERLAQALFTSCQAGPTPDDSLKAAIAAAVEFAFESPSRAYLLAFAFVADELELPDRGRSLQEHLLDLLRSNREASIGGDYRLQPIERAAVLGAIEVVSIESRSGSADRAGRLASELFQLLSHHFSHSSVARS